ncbi:hemagglutinin repeat-containing protein [Caviibacterium pharyngocola]|uniref:Adhesin n=1 Tax=Caviibacterium pharyngocola TaxID=28159 RepID=A0A2M8RZ23_9PAST|nr:hemagglutinin repeat-containing protein [Caviibacterium pharyngocola]PJG84135.1 hypothetical protein CVP04_00015 [Caviibacterium pharyngocola]
MYTTQHTRIEANEIDLIAGNQLEAVGIEAVAQGDMRLSADNIHLKADTNARREHYVVETKKSGVFSGGGLGITIGSQQGKQAHQQAGWTQSDARATLGSLNGSVSIEANNRVQLTGTDVITPNNLTIKGYSIDIDAGKDRIVSTESREVKQSGLTLALSSPVTDMALKAQQSLKRANEVKSDKLKSLYQLKAAQEAALAAQSVGQVAETLSALTNNTMQQGEVPNPSVKLSLSVGASKSSQHSHTEQVIHRGSELTAGNLQLSTTEGDLTVKGSKLQANHTALSSGNDINLLSVQNEYHNRTDSKNSGWSAGVFVGASGIATVEENAGYIILGLLECNFICSG